MITNKNSGVYFKKDSKGKLRQWECQVIRSEDPDLAYSKVISGLCEGKLSNRSKPIESSKVKSAFDRAVALMENTVVKKIREGYHPDKESALNADVLFKPMKAEEYNPEEPLEPMFSVQPKINGCRALYNWESNKLHSKSMLEYTVKYVHKELKQFADIVGASVDGELYIDGLTAPEISGAARNPQNKHAGDFVYWLYDLVTDEGFEIRKEKVKEGFAKYEDLYGKPKYLIWTPTYDIKFLKDLKPKYERFLDDGFEGLMVRKWGTPYEFKRTKNLLKWKPVMDKEFEVVHITYERRKGVGVGTPILYLVEFHCKCDAGRFKVIPAWSVDKRHQFWLDNKDKSLQDVLGELLPLRVEFREWTKDGFPFHAVGIEFRDPRF